MHQDFASVHFGNMLGNGKADAAAADLADGRIAAAVKFVENLLLLGLRNAYALIGSRTGL